MKLTTATIIIALSAAFGIGFILRALHRDAIGIRAALTWIGLWIIIGLFSLMPAALDPFMHLAQMQSRTFFIVLSALLVLFALVFSIHSRLDRLERDRARILQELSLLVHRLEDNGNGRPAPAADDEEAD